MQGMNRVTGAPLSGLDHIRQSITDILTTRVGTRVMRRDYGSDLPSLVDRPMNEDLKLDLFAATILALERWEPRVRVQGVAVETVAETGRIALSLTAIYVPDQSVVQIEGILVE